MSPQFGSTQWSIVLAAKDAAHPRAQAAMASLCTAYWRPLYAYVRRSGYSVEDAQDLTQSFFFHLLEKNSLRNVDPSLGKFRTFLLTSLKNFLTNAWRREHASKRGGDTAIASLEDLTRAEESYTAGPADSETPERVFERNWALALLDRTTTRLATEFAAAGKGPVFDVLKPYLTGDRDMSYSQAASTLGMNEVTVRVAVHRMRGRFRDLLLLEVADTLPHPAGPGALDEELRYLLAVL